MIIMNISREILKDYINWEHWDRVVEETKQEIRECLKDYENTKRKNSYACYGYNQDGELVHVWSNLKEMTKAFDNNCSATICKYVKNQWVLHGCLVTKEKLSKDTAFELYKRAIEHGNVFSTEHKANPVYTYNQNGKLVGVYRSMRTWAEKEHDNKSISTIYYEDRIVNDKLVSLNKYDEEKAKQQYSHTKQVIPRLYSKRRKYDVYNLEGELVKKNCNVKQVVSIIGMTQYELNKLTINSEEFNKNGFLVKVKY